MGRVGILALWVGILAGVSHAASTTVASQPAPPPKRLISVQDSPGYQPLHDPDSLADQLGRRPSAALVSTSFTGGARSLEALGRAICGALHTDAPDSMLKLCLTPGEFRVILWPEFPQSRPATGLVWTDAWQVLNGRLVGGSTAFARDFGGHVYTFIAFERTAATKVYKNFKLHNGVVLVAKDDEGKTHRFPFIRSIAERKGRFKIYSMTD
ncbi:MAG: hypothetical protein ABL977_02100 [Candidatus Eisenbacteria bacterium]